MGRQGAMSAKQISLVAFGDEHTSARERSEDNFLCLASLAPWRRDPLLGAHGALAARSSAWRSWRLGGDPQGLPAARQLARLRQLVIARHRGRLLERWRLEVRRLARALERG